jgi:hypothetical protein
MLSTVNAKNDLLDEKPRPHPDAAMEKVGGRWMVATPDDQLHYFVARAARTPATSGTASSTWRTARARCAR